jgi:hypothetical protein
VRPDPDLVPPLGDAVHVAKAPRHGQVVVPRREVDVRRHVVHQHGQRMPLPPHQPLQQVRAWVIRQYNNLCLNLIAIPSFQCWCLDQTIGSQERWVKTKHMSGGVPQSGIRRTKKGNTRERGSVLESEGTKQGDLTFPPEASPFCARPGRSVVDIASRSANLRLHDLEDAIELRTCEDRNTGSGARPSLANARRRPRSLHTRAKTPLVHERAKFQRCQEDDLRKGSPLRVWAAFCLSQGSHYLLPSKRPASP